MACRLRVVPSNAAKVRFTGKCSPNRNLTRSDISRGFVPETLQSKVEAKIPQSHFCGGLLPSGRFFAFIATQRTEDPLYKPFRHQLAFTSVSYAHRNSALCAAQSTWIPRMIHCSYRRLPLREQTHFPVVSPTLLQPCGRRPTAMEPLQRFADATGSLLHVWNAEGENSSATRHIRVAIAPSSSATVSS